MARSQARSSFTATRPMERTAFRTNSTSTPVAHSLSSRSTCSKFFSVTSMTIMSTFSSFTYTGSLYLQKNIFTSAARMPGRFCTISRMFRKETYWVSGSLESNVTKGGFSFLASMRNTSVLSTYSIAFRMTLIAASTTAGFTCERRAVTRSVMDSASPLLEGTYVESASRMKTWPHSLHSFSAASSFGIVALLSRSSKSRPHVSAISARPATAFATTIGFGSDNMSFKISMNPWSSTSSGLMSYTLGMHMAEVFRTYGSGSWQHLRSGSKRYSVT
mmetsp:Transcript_76810/g.212226  ORF Transcript_76810/g.212226 Transcript_76810/m.212226 type:complete len:275 (-) Transcript_76810:546-1370(-)